MNIKNYIIVTKEWINNATPNSHEVKEKLYFKDENGDIHKVDGKNVVLDYSKQEKEIAIWLENTFGGEIYLLPKINSPIKISTPDYLWNQEKWDLKNINGNGKHTLDSAIKKKKNQSQNFILDLSNSNLSKKEIQKQINLIFKSKNRFWISKIIIKKKSTIIIYKKKTNHQSQNTDQD